MLEAKQKHIDFVVGRGRVKYTGGLNLSMSPAFQTRNVVYIDQDSDTRPDITEKFEQLDLTNFGITNNDDPEHDIHIRFIFDWSSFYCGAFLGIHHISTHLRRPYSILVPLHAHENHMPPEIQRVLWQKHYTKNIISGNYPLFDWSTRNVSNFVNPDVYVEISYLSTM